MMNVCIKCGELQQALDVFALMKNVGCEPNIVTYNTLIDVYGKTGQSREALQVLETMRCTGVKPVLRTFNTLIIACNTCGNWQEALSIYDALLAAGHEPNTTTYNAIISSYSKGGKINKVRPCVPTYLIFQIFLLPHSKSLPAVRLLQNQSGPSCRQTSTHNVAGMSTTVVF
jgi:pentatricopeptide repeat protein